MFSSHLGSWFETSKDVLFAVEFLLVQVYLIYHLVRALFFPERKVAVRIDGEQNTKLIPSPNGRGPQARAPNCGCHSGREEALPVGKHEAVPGPAFDHRGRRDPRRADHAADRCGVAPARITGAVAPKRTG